MAAGLRQGIVRDPEATSRTLRNWQHLSEPSFSLTPVRTVSAETTLTFDDWMLNCTGGTFTVNLPTARGIPGRPYVVRKSTVGTITVKPNGAETINGSANITVTNGNVARLISDDTGNWLTW